MQSEDFDKKIKHAAEHHHPAYDEKAWEKMLKLLDKHLPANKEEKRRRGFIFLLFFLFIGGTGVLFTIKWNNSRSVKIVKSSSNSFPQEQLNNKELLKGETTIDVQKFNSDKPVTDKTNLLKKLTEKDNIKKDRKSITGINNTPGYTIQGKNYSKNFIKNNKSRRLISQSSGEIADINEIGKKDLNTDQSLEITHSKDSIKTNLKADVSAYLANFNNKLNNIDSVTDEKAENTSIAKKNYFYFSLSTGPDVSFTGSDNLGRVKLLAGVGLGYTFKDKFTISSGFYSVKKIYSASPDAYKPPATFYNYYPYLEKVDADCKVYEIPLLISYNLGWAKKGNWLISTGVSSYLMKRETYSYYYKYSPSGPTVNKKWTLSDKNKHYFSVITLSGGYKFRFNKTISVSIEPYAKIPLKGVGYGKVKLNSGGILLSIGVKPFNSKNK
jgi:hypothetical protein